MKTIWNLDEILIANKNILDVKDAEELRSKAQSGKVSETLIRSVVYLVSNWADENGVSMTYELKDQK